MTNAFPDRDLGPQLQHWRQTGMEMEISSLHMDESDKLFEAAGMAEEYAAPGCFRCIRGETLARFDRRHYPVSKPHGMSRLFIGRFVPDSPAPTLPCA
jgi:hypothetical protein